MLWAASNVGRRFISRLPHPARFAFSQTLAATVYFPMARGAKVIEKLGAGVDGLPLSQYRNNSFYTMRTDALDRFGTRLEKRFTKVEMREMMQNAGLEIITFADTAFWTAIGFKT